MRNTPIRTVHNGMNFAEWENKVPLLPTSPHLGVEKMHHWSADRAPG